MASELHSRLEYLVNYSSQLIFVSGDSIAEQQRTLESFVFQQSENTELAFITAESGMSLTDYRGTLCKQLLGQLVGTYVRPLNELLAGLNHHEGPVLITITQAQYIPNEFLQELWELVLQSRFANNKQHLNVLLFGETEWAEQAKEWLPAKNTSTPLLISSHSVTQEQYSSDVDRLLAERRAAFERYRQERGTMTARPTGNSRMRSPWMWAVIGLVFVSTFVAMMGWQYGATLSTLFNPIDSAEQTDNAPSPMLIESEIPVQTFSVEKQAQVNEPTTSQVASPENNTQNDQDRIVSSFDAALKALPTEVSNTTDELTDNHAATDTQSALSDPQLESPSALPIETSPTVTDLSTANIAVEQDTDLDNKELEQLATSGYWIQIAGMKDLSLAEDFLSDHNLADKVKIYRTYRYGGDWFVILLNTKATTLAEARKQLSSLEGFPGSEKAFIKSSRQVKAELNTDQ